MRMAGSFRRAAPLTTVLIALAGGPGAALAAERAPVPKTRVDQVVEKVHGIAVRDPYRWLEDQKSPETRAWIDAQNQYTRSVLDPLPGRDRIRRRLEELLRIDTISIPVVRGGRYFFTKRLAGQNLPVIYVRNGPSGKDEPLVDPTTMSADQTTSVSMADISDDGKLLAYGIRQGGEDEQALAFLDADSRQHRKDRLPRARYSGISLKPDKSGFYYARYNPGGTRIYYHRMGSDPAGDGEIFGQGYGPQQILFPSLSQDGRYLTLTVLHGSNAAKVEIYVKDVAKDGPITPIVNDLEARFQSEVEGDRMFLHTNWGAPNGRIFDVDLKNPARRNWREIVPETSAVNEGFSAAGGRIFVSYLDNVSPRIKVFEPSGKHVRDISLPGLGSASGLSGLWSSDEAFYSFASFAYPSTIYRYQVSSGKQEVWARVKVPLESEQLEVKQVWYQSKDKTRVPMFLFHRKDLRPDGQRPTLLTGYGGFDVSLTPSFSAHAALWAEMGGVYAVPNLRGGGEFGEKWHRAGMFESKQNVFDDFIGAAEWLIENGYTRPSNLSIMGRSNGGLLVGAAMNQRPDLFQAVVCGYPLLDMVRYHRFLVARFWVSEYGSADDAKQFQYLHRYSPYHNVKPGTKYPAVLFMTGDADTRVDPLHARKMAPLVQTATGSDRPVLLWYDTKAGHVGAQPVNRQVTETTDWLSFLFWQLGGRAD